MFAEQGAPLARASEKIPVSGSPLSVEVRREENLGRDGRGELTGDLEANGVWHWGCRLLISDLALILDVVAESSVATTSYDTQFPSSSSHHHSKPSQPNS